MAKKLTTHMLAGVASLQDILVDGQKISTIITHVSASGMSCGIRLMTIVPASGPYPSTIRDITWNVARALGERWNENHRAVIVSGGGMDMAWDTVDRLNHALGIKLVQCGL